MANVHEQLSFSGTLTAWTQTDDALDRAIEQAQQIGDEESFLYLLSLTIPVKQWQCKNAVVQSGREVFSRILANDTTYTGIPNYGALGTSTTAVSDSDTTLATEVFRKKPGAYQRSADSTTIYWYYNKADTNGTYEEFGAFIDGSSSADSGQMYNRALTGGWAKTSSEGLTVTLQIDLSNV